MPRKKKEQTLLPPAQTRSIECAFCQKELNPLTEGVAFIGMGKWRDGPGLFHAVCTAKTPEGKENLISSMGYRGLQSSPRKNPFG